MTRRPIRLAQLAIVLCVLEASAVLTTRSFGIQPYFFVGVAIFLRLSWITITRGAGIGRHRALTSSLVSLALLLLWGGASAVLFPVLFADLPVYAPDLGLDRQVDEGTPLGHSLSHLAQIVYLTLNVAVVVYAAAHAHDHRDIGRLHRAFLVAGGAAVIVAALQGLAFAMGLPFPYALLQNNPSLAIRHQITFEGVLRLSGTFSEASHLAVFGSGFLAYLLSPLLFRRHLTPVRAALGVLTAGVLVWTTSSTAYLMLALLAAVLGCAAFVRSAVFARLNVRAAIAWIACALGALTVLAMSTPLRAAIAEALLGKAESRSFEVRLAADADALGIFARSFGLGVGLGSNRPSSFLTSLLSTVGIVGTLLFAVAVVLIVVACLRLRTDGRGASAASFGLVFVLVAKAIASPDLSTPSMWVLIALSAASLSVAAKTAGARVRIGLFGTAPVPGPRRSTVVSGGGLPERRT